jgi:phosphotransferase system, enzyme I, PtsP
MPRSPSPLEITSRVAKILQNSIEGQLDQVVTFLKGALGCNVVSVYACRQDGYLLIANEGFSKDKVEELVLSKGRGLVHHIIKTGKTLCLSDATTHLSFYYVQGIGEEKYHGFIGAPIKRDGEQVGALIFQYTRKFDSSLEDIALIETISQQIGHLTHAPEAEQSNQTVEAKVNGRGVVTGRFHGKSVKRLTFDEGPNLSKETGQGFEIEQKRLEAAHLRSQLFLQELKAECDSKEMEDILGAHLVMLADPKLREKEEEYLQKNASAEQAVTYATMDLAEMFKGMKDTYMQQRSVDIIDVGRRVYHSLKSSKEAMSEEDGPKEKSVYLVKQLPPTVLIEEGPKLYGALVLVDENVYSHTIILAKSMGIPAVIISREQLDSLMEAQEIFVDGELGLVVPDPDELWLKVYQKAHEALEQTEEQGELPPCKTKNGTPITLAMNGGFIRDTENLPPWIPEIGLFRTEFQFYTSQRIPSEEQLTSNYSRILTNVGNRPTTLRILDAGADKQPPCLHFVHEDNPVLGARSIRFLLKNSDIFFSQLRAMLKAMGDTGGQLRILIPMVSVYEEVSRIRDHIIKVIRDLRQENYRLKMPQLGAMIEIPSCIQLIPKISSMVDFYCVGTNDLLQYYIAVDRTNSLVQYLYKWYQPSFLMALKQIAVSCEEEKRDFSICGEMAGEMWGSLVLLGLGYRNLSMDRQSIYRHHALVRNSSLRSLERLANKLIQRNTGLEVLEQLQLFLDKWSLPKELKNLLQSELNAMINPS